MGNNYIKRKEANTKSASFPEFEMYIQYQRAQLQSELTQPTKVLRPATANGSSARPTSTWTGLRQQKP